MTSVVIAAHNEEAVIGACLDAVLAQRDVDELEVIVSANGCTDRTVEVATQRGVVVLDLPGVGKASALNAGDGIAKSFPRIYLDADIVLPPHALSGLVSRLATDSTIVATVPRRALDTTGRPWLVKSYFAINERLPAFRNGLFGRGLIALSEQGRARFASFPEMVADDLFLDSQFRDDEKAELSDVEVRVAAPRTTRALVRRLVRVRRGNSDMRAALGEHVRHSDKWAWLRDVALSEPRLLPAAVPYVLITLLAGFLARRSPGTQSWGRDESTRVHPHA